MSKKLCIRNTIYAGVERNDRQYQSLSAYPISRALFLALKPFFTEFSALLSIYILASILASTLENFYSNERKSIEFQGWIWEAVNAHKSPSYNEHYRREDLAHCKTV